MNSFHMQLRKPANTSLINKKQVKKVKKITKKVSPIRVNPKKFTICKVLGTKGSRGEIK